MKIKFAENINALRIIKYIYALKWDFAFIIIFIMILLSLHLYLMQEEIKVSNATSDKFDLSNSPYFSFEKKQIKNFNYDINRDIFNFQNSKSSEAVLLDKEENKDKLLDSPFIIYNGMAKIGEEKVVTFSNEGKQYIAKEGEIVENKFKIIKANKDYLLIIYLPSNKLIKIESLQ